MMKLVTPGGSTTPRKPTKTTPLAICTPWIRTSRASRRDLSLKGLTGRRLTGRRQRAAVLVVRKTEEMRQMMIVRRVQRTRPRSRRRNG